MLLFLAHLSSIWFLGLEKRFKSISWHRIIYFLPCYLKGIILYSFQCFFSWIELYCLSILLHYLKFWLLLFCVSFLFILLGVSWLRLIDLHFVIIILSGNKSYYFGLGLFDFDDLLVLRFLFKTRVMLL